MAKKKIIIIIAIAAVIVAAIVSAVLVLNKSSYEVKFYSDSDVLIKNDSVNRGDSAVPPKDPTISYGNVFLKWDTEISKVKKNLEVKPLTESFIGKKNVFVLPGTYFSQGESGFTSLKLCGDVCAAGFSMTIQYDSENLALQSVYDEDGEVIYNTDTPGKIEINFVSAGNAEADIDVCSFKFASIGEAGEYPLTITVDKVCALEENEEITDTEYNVISSSVFVLPKEVS